MTTEPIPTTTLANIIGCSPSMQQLRESIHRLAACDVNVLLQGESGTGKELVAQTIHQLSRRRSKSFTGVNCAAIHESLLESELFGHEDGAFTGARGETLGLLRATDGGTILLDEVGDMSMALQCKLLRVLEERAVVPVGGTRRIGVDIRVISASNQDVGEAVHNKTFRLDLFYRLNTISLVLPPLRHRREDIALLADHLLRSMAALLAVEPKTLTPRALELLNNHDWPGNVRQLANVIQRAYVLGAGPVIDAEHLPDQIARPGSAAQATFPTLKEITRRHIGEALQRSGGIRIRASALLGIDRKSLARLIRRYGIAQ